MAIKNGLEGNLELLSDIRTRQKAVVYSCPQRRWYFNCKFKWDLLYPVVIGEVRWSCVRGVPIDRERLDMIFCYWKYPLTCNSYLTPTTSNHISFSLRLLIFYLLDGRAGLRTDCTYSFYTNLFLEDFHGRLGQLTEIAFGDAGGHD